MIKKQVKKNENEGIDAEIPEIKHPKIDVNINTSDHASLKELVEKNIKWSQVIYEQNKKIKSRLTWMVVGSYLRLAIIIIPIILALIYLPPLLKGVFSQYSSLLGGLGGAPQVNDFLGDVSSSQIQDLLKTFGR